MKAKEKTLYAVYTNSDLTEGRGREYVIHFTTHSSTANRLGKGKYVMGSNCPVRKVTAYEIDGKTYVTGVAIEPLAKPDEAAEKILEDEKKRLAILEKIKDQVTSEEYELLLKLNNP